MAEDELDQDLDGTITWAVLLAETTELLRRSRVTDNPVGEARWIVEEATGTRGAEFHETLGTLATVRAVAHLDAMVERRRVGEPIQYVLGSWGFRTLDLMVDRRVLIPRPETEVLVGLALEELERMRPNGGGTVVDLGTGSGAVGLAVAAESAAARVLLTDRSSDALAVARANLAGLGSAGRSVEVVEGDWWAAVPHRYLGECDVIASNPPYITDVAELPASVEDWEPTQALRAGTSGLDDLEIIVAGASKWLRPTGALVLEMASEQTAVVAARAAALGFDVAIHDDLAGCPRVMVARLA